PATTESLSRRSSQVQRVGKFQAPFGTTGANGPGWVGETLEAPEPPALGLVAVHREEIRIASARVHHVILAPGDLPLHPCVDDVECERRVHWNRRMKRRRRLPGAGTNAPDVLAVRPRRLQREWPAVARDHETIARQPGHEQLHALER